MSAGQRFAERFIEATGAGLDLFERARQGKLPHTLEAAPIARLVVGAKADGFAQYDAILNELRWACLNGQLPCRETLGSPGVPVQVTRDPSMTGQVARRVEMRGATPPRYFVHRDQVRRYFQAMDLMPEQGSALWCWLRDARADDPKKRRQDQEDKADFQQLCLEYWEVSPLTRITGKQGIVALLGSAYVREWSQKTVENWARAIAPDAVKAQAGRPKNPPSA